MALLGNTQTVQRFHRLNRPTHFFSRRGWFFLIVWGLLAGRLVSASAAVAGWRQLSGHVPTVTARLTAWGTLSETNQLDLAIGLPLRDAAGLKALTAQLYDPQSPLYRKFPAVTNLLERFGPSAADFAAVQAFAASNHLTLRADSADRLVLDVHGAAGDVQRAFHLTLRQYHHPTEARDFYAPDVEPSVPNSLPVADIWGLSNYGRARHHAHVKPVSVINAAEPHSGSGTNGSYFGSDFRAAYLPGVSLTGAGQMVGLLQFDGYYASDIAAFEQAAGFSAVPLQNVTLDGYNGIPTTGSGSGNIEVSLDIEMCISMAPGLSGIVVFEGNPNMVIPADVLNAMLTYSNQLKQCSSSWGWGGGPDSTIDSIFQLMDAAGMQYFNASGDSDAFTVGQYSSNGVDNTAGLNAPSSSPYITQVGGTTLTTTGPGGSYVSEKAWNWNYNSSSGSYVGTSGGVSSYYTIPAWQTNLNFTTNGGDAGYRNIPDVALTADNILVYYNNGSNGKVGGTSCAAPLWAGLMALINQQAEATGAYPVGFLNPTLYSLATGAGYNLYYHDITTGSNCWSASTNQYFAVRGYDLCTGLGTPNGQALINAIAGVVGLSAAPVAIRAGGTAGGPLTLTNNFIILTNLGNSSLNWRVTVPVNWLTLTATNGTLAAGAGTNLQVSLNSSTSNLWTGNYVTTLNFSNATVPAIFSVGVNLQVNSPLTSGGLSLASASGPEGGPFAPSTGSLLVTNLGQSSTTWGLMFSSNWLQKISGGGSLAGGASTLASFGLTTAANSLLAGTYTNYVTVTNWAGAGPTLPFALVVGASLVQNGGFETGDFTGWTLVGNTTTVSQGQFGLNTTTYNAVESAAAYPLGVHSGNYGAFLGDTNPATLSQTLATVPGQRYLVSLWLDNPTGGSGELCQLRWSSGGTTNLLIGLTNPAAFTWTNYLFLTTATATNSSLQFTVENIPNFFGLDDVSVTPLPTVGFHTLARNGTNQMSLTWFTVTNAVYQVQSTTNLLAPNWQNLGSAVTASNGILSGLDTNSLTGRSQRYYRLIVTP